MKRCCWILLFVAAGLAAVPAEAQKVGVRGGVSFEPEQIYFGVHAESGPVADELRFRPNAEVGFGDDLTVVALNGEFVYPFYLQNGTQLYVGGGPAIVIYTRDRPNQPDNDTDVEPGFNFLIGIVLAEDYFAEFKVGVIDSPEVKLGFGYTFP